MLGLGLLVASVDPFAFANSVCVLDIARFVQGLGCAASWAGALGWLIGAAPRERRGELIGTAMAAAVVGALFGPGARRRGRRAGHRSSCSAPSRSSAAALMVWALRTPSPAGRRPVRRCATCSPVVRDRARRRRHVARRCSPGCCSARSTCSAPLRLDELGAGTAAIAAAFLVGAALEATMRPFVGRLSDRRGRLLPCVVGLAAGGVAMALAPVAAARRWLLGADRASPAPAIGILYTPAMAMLSDGAEAFGIAQGFAFALINLAWAAGQAVGDGGQRAARRGAGDHVPYLILAALCAVTFASCLSRAAGSAVRRRATGTPAAP